MTRGYNFEKPIPINGIGFSWRPYSDEDFLSEERFSLDQWHKIIYDIDDMTQWRNFLDRYRKVCSCYSLYPSREAEPIAICYLLAEDGLYDEYTTGDVISVHGGGWKTDTRSCLLYARSWIKMIHHLHSLGCKVLTNVKSDNLRAKHLVTGSGFRINEMGLYEYDSTRDKFHLFSADIDLGGRH